MLVAEPGVMRHHVQRGTAWKIRKHDLEDAAGS